MTTRATHVQLVPGTYVQVSADASGAFLATNNAREHIYIVMAATQPPATQRGHRVAAGGTISRFAAGIMWARATGPGGHIVIDDG